MRIRINIEIYTDARAMSPPDTDIINLESGAGIGGDSRRKWGSMRIFPVSNHRQNTRLGKWGESLHRLISSFELLGTYVGKDYGRHIVFAIQIFCG